MLWYSSESWTFAKKSGSALDAFIGKRCEEYLAQ
jgi:hypothetical protein